MPTRTLRKRPRHGQHRTGTMARAIAATAILTAITAGAGAAPPAYAAIELVLRADQQTHIIPKRMRDRFYHRPELMDDFRDETRALWDRISESIGGALLLQLIHGGPLTEQYINQRTEEKYKGQLKARASTMRIRCEPSTGKSTATLEVGRLNFEYRTSDDGTPAWSARRMLRNLRGLDDHEWPVLITTHERSHRNRPKPLQGETTGVFTSPAVPTLGDAVPKQIVVLEDGGGILAAAIANERDFTARIQTAGIRGLRPQLYIGLHFRTGNWPTYRARLILEHCFDGPDAETGTQMREPAKPRQRPSGVWRPGDD